MKRCKLCIYPNTKPGLEFIDGVCLACINAKIKETIDWNKKDEQLKELLNRFRNEDYWDCIIPVSGGKDSHFQAWTMKYKYGMNPLLVNFQPNDLTELGRKNLDNLYNLGFDIIEFKPNPHIYKRLVYYGFTQLGDCDFPQHLGIFSTPKKIASALGINLIIWGENPYFEYGGNKNYIDDFWGNSYNDLIKFGFTAGEINPYFEFDRDDLTSIYLGDYIFWNAYNQVEEMVKHGLTIFENPKPGNYERYENLDTKYVNLHDYFKFLKYGFARATDQLSIAIRQGRISRIDACHLANILDPQLDYECLREFKKEFNIDDSEFEKTCERFRNEL